MIVADCLPTWCLAYKDRIHEGNVFKTKMSRKSDMAGPFISGDGTSNKHFSVPSLQMPQKALSDQGLQCVRYIQELM